MEDTKKQTKGKSNTLICGTMLCTLMLVTSNTLITNAHTQEVNPNIPIVKTTVQPTQGTICYQEHGDNCMCDKFVDNTIPVVTVKPTHTATATATKEALTDVLTGKTTVYKVGNTIVTPQPTTKPTLKEEQANATTIQINKAMASSYSKGKPYNIPLSADLQRHIINKCKKYGISPNIIIGMIDTESTFDHNVMGDYGHSYGLMQIQKRYHYDTMKRLGCYNLLNSYDNVNVGIDIFAHLYYKYGNYHKALMAYNGGEGYADYRIKRGILRSKYSRKVMNKAYHYKAIRKY